VGVPFWIYEQLPTYRLTGRHAWAEVSQESQFVTGDGAWAVAQPAIGANWGRLVKMLEAHDAVDDLADPRYEDVRYRSSSEVAGHVTEVMLGFTLMHTAEEVMEAGQEAGLPWGAVRRPEENAADPHWQQRGMFEEIEHPEHGRSFTHVAAPWMSEDMPWRVGARAPLVGEHTAAVLAELGLDEATP
jgi:crotonobetainyl-CoA:carnitine CoA-transferase CaiB-like acyl-CoA transferase